MRFLCNIVFTELDGISFTVGTALKFGPGFQLHDVYPRSLSLPVALLPWWLAMGAEICPVQTSCEILDYHSWDVHAKYKYKWKWKSKCTFNLPQKWCWQNRKRLRIWRISLPLFPLSLSSDNKSCSGINIVASLTEWTKEQQWSVFRSL